MAIVAALLLACSTAQPEDERAAVRRAERFATLVAVDQRFEQAYGMMSQTEQTRTTREALEDGIRSQHPAGFPSQVRATEYLPVPKHDAVKVYLVGKLGSERLYYLIGMQRISGRYYPSGCFVSKEPFPDSGQPRQPVDE